MQTITIPAKTFEKILSKLDDLVKDVRDIKSKLFEKEPPYGSDEWWEWSNKKAMEDIKAGRYTKLHNKKELHEYFDSLKSAS